MSLALEDLIAFIKAAKAQGATDVFLVAMLRQNGWSERRVYAAFTAYYQEATGRPVPARGGRIESSRDAFMYLITFGALGTWACAFVFLADALVDFYWPNTLAGTSGIFLRQSVSGELAAIIIAFPLFLLLTRHLLRDLAQRPEAREAEVRHGLTYLALAVAFAVLMGDAIFFLQQFLSGDLTLRFIVKTAVLSMVAGGIFVYYLLSLRPLVRAAWDRGFALVASFAVAIAVVVGFTGIGSPSHERALAADERRTTDLDFIESAIARKYETSHRLPQALLALDPENTHDPVSGQLYLYKPGLGSRYELCATFQTANDADHAVVKWRHRAGLQCFTRNAKS